MGIEYREERSGSKIQLFSYCDEKKTGAICALSDGYDWALICDVWADKAETEKKLIREMILKLQCTNKQSLCEYLLKFCWQMTRHAKTFVSKIAK